VSVALVIIGVGEADTGLDGTQRYRLCLRTMSDPLTINAIEDDSYAMANLRPASTGLPMAVWVSERANNPHDVRVKVCRVHGDKMQFDNTASVAVRPHPHIAVGNLSTDDLQAVTQWITINSDTLIDYWNGAIDTLELARRLRPLDPPIAP
jgi:hypothetical protein